MKKDEKKGMKEALRRRYQERRGLLSPDEVKARSRKIIERLRRDPLYQNARTVLIYVSKGNEVHTHPLLEEKKKRIAVPKVRGDDLLCCHITSIEELSIGRFGVLEPLREKIVPYAEIDLAVVPGITFDKEGNRIGYGMGFYDRLLAKLPCPKIGLAFSFQITDKIAATESDVEMDKVITDEGHWP